MKILFIIKTYHDSDKYFEDKLSTFKNKNYKQINKIFCDFYCNWISDFYDELSKDSEVQIIFANTFELINNITDKITKKNYFEYLNYIFNEFKPDILFTNTDEKNLLSKLNLSNCYNIFWKSSKIEKKDENSTFKFFDHLLSDNEKILKQAKKHGLKENFFLASIPEKLLSYNEFSKRQSKLLFSGSIGYEHAKRRKIISTLQKEKIDLEIRSRNIKNYNKYFEKILKIFPFLKSGYELSTISKNPLYGIELFDYMSKFKYILNSHSDFDINYAINYRVFESLASGCLLFTDQNKKLDNYFIDEKHLITYKNKNDLVEKINFYKNNENLAEELSGNGYDIIKQNHTSNIRLREFKKILQI